MTTSNDVGKSPASPDATETPGLALSKQSGFADAVRYVLRDTLELPSEFLNYINQYSAVNPLPIPVSQLTGFTQYVAQSSTTIDTSESTTSTAYTDLTTVGPSLTNLAAGKYLVLFGFTGNGAAFMSVNINGTNPPSDTSPGSVSCLNNNNTSVSGWFSTSLTAASNSLTAKYRAGSGVLSTFEFRKMFALRYGNI